MLNFGSSWKIEKKVDLATYFFSFSGEWKVFTGPKLLEGLLGACAAPLNSRQIILMGGYSALTNDYTDNAYILTTSTKEWEKKNWAKLKNGPRLDLSCASVNWNQEKYVLTAGGWNNSATNTSELVSNGNERIESITKNMPFKMRSAAMGELNSQPILAGGVICTG